MRYLLPAITLLYISISCRISEKSLTGVYSPERNQRTRLILREDKTFEFALLNPATDTLIFRETNPSNFSTTGYWEYDKKGLVLKSSRENLPVTAQAIDDSVTHFTSISSMNFWNRYGDPVPIRYILLPPARTKPHFGNSLYFFVQDFKQSDTLRFYFDGYPPFNFPGSIPPTIGNNMHKIVLNEPYRHAPLPSLSFIVKKDKLLYTANKLRLLKRK
jgi:hypothetical protein